MAVRQLPLPHWLALTAVVSIACVYLADSARAPYRLKLIPEPRQIRFTAGRHRFSEPVLLGLGEPVTEASRFAAGELRGELAETLGSRSSLAPPARASIVLETTDRRTLSERARELGMSPVDSLGYDAYMLAISPERIVIVGSSDAGTFYGVQTLKQIVRANRRADAVPCLRILDWAGFRYRGWQDDVSRGPIPTLDFMKREVRTLAEFKLNLLTLYTEHVFKLNKHPAIAPPDGITADEVAELVEYAKRYHVEVAGNFQSFGHFDNILRVPGYEHLGETPSLLSPAYEESYAFLADVYDEIAPAYESELFHVNCDEVRHLGTGAARSLVNTLGDDRVYLYHVQRIDRLLKRHGKRIMMWGDLVREDARLAAGLPEDAILVFWDYEGRDSFAEEVRPFATVNREFLVSPGTSSWGQVWPDLDRATRNIHNLLRDGHAHGAAGVISATWDDDGENLFHSNWWPLIWGAECAWNPPAKGSGRRAAWVMQQRLLRFNTALDAIFFGADGVRVTDSMWILSDLRSYAKNGTLRNEAFWRRVIADPEPRPRQDNERMLSDIDLVMGSLEAARHRATRNKDAIDCGIFAARRAAMLARKDQLRARAMRSLLEGSSEVASSELKEEMAELAEEAILLKEMFGILWDGENRPWWKDRVLGRYEVLAADLAVDAAVLARVMPPRTGDAQVLVD